MMQTQTQVPPALQMLMSMGAQPTAPGPMGQPIPTIATQKVEQQAQGLEALMPGVRQQAMQSAQAAQPVTQAQLQQALQQRAPGIAGLPAENMQFAEGGVVGYAGPDGSDVELDVSGRIKKALRDWYERTERGYMERAGATPEMIAQKLGQEPPATRAAELPEASYSNESRIGLASKPVAPVAATGIADPRLAAARNAVARTQPRAEMAAPMLPDTRESTAVNPSEAALMYAQTQGAIKKLGERLRQRPEESQAEKDYRAAAMAEYQRGLGSLTSSQERFEKAKQERLASQEGRGLSDLASFLSRAGGAGSLFRGLGQAQIGMEPVFAARAAEEQKFREQELAFKDRWDERRGIVENLKLATLKNDAEAQRAWANELRKNDAEMTRLGITLGTERMKELSTGEREAARTAAMVSEGALDRASRERDRQAQAALRNLPTYEQQMAQRVMDDYIRKNPGATLSDAYDFYRGAGKPTDRAVLTYAQAAKIVDERLSSPTALMMLEKEEQKLAKQQGRAPRSTAQMRADLIRQEQEMAGKSAAAPTGAPAALPPGVTVKRIGQ